SRTDSSFADERASLQLRLSATRRGGSKLKPPGPGSVDLARSQVVLSIDEETRWCHRHDESVTGERLDDAGGGTARERGRPAESRVERGAQNVGSADRVQPLAYTGSRNGVGFEYEVTAGLAHVARCAL